MHNTDNLRTSRDRVIAKGELYWAEVDVLNISDDSTTRSLREGLEQFGIKVNVYYVGLADHIKKILGPNPSAAPYLIITAHGGENDGDLDLGGKLSDEIAATQDFDEKMTPQDLAKFIDVSNRVVINTACGGGEEKLAEVFTKVGKAKAYIADTYAPFGYVSYLFPILVFYFLTKYSLSIKESFEKAKACDREEFKTWHLFNS